MGYEETDMRKEREHEQPRVKYEWGIAIKLRRGKTGRSTHGKGGMGWDTRKQTGVRRRKKSNKQ